MHRFKNSDRACAVAMQHLKTALHAETGASPGDVNPMKLAGYIRKIAANHLAFHGVKNTDINWMLHSTGAAGRDDKKNSNTVREWWV